MKRNKILTGFTWELKNLFRFPLPEVLLAFFVYLFFLPHGGAFSFSISIEQLILQEINREIAFLTIYEAARLSLGTYLPLGIFASIFATLSFAYEIENGLLKIYLSHPFSRTEIFLSKFLSCFFVIFTTFSIGLLTYTFLKIPENTIYIVLSIDLLLRILILTILECFFIVSLTISFSVFSGKASISLIGSFVVIYVLQLLSESTTLSFLPPTSFKEQASMLFSLNTPQFFDILNFMVTPLISTFLIVFSYLYFSRRLEIS